MHQKKTKLGKIFLGYCEKISKINAKLASFWTTASLKCLYWNCQIFSSHNQMEYHNTFRWSQERNFIYRRSNIQWRKWTTEHVGTVPLDQQKTVNTQPFVRQLSSKKIIFTKTKQTFFFDIWRSGCLYGLRQFVQTHVEAYIFHEDIYASIFWKTIVDDFWWLILAFVLQ